jgi:hypothetical protein
METTKTYIILTGHTYYNQATKWQAVCDNQGWPQPIIFDSLKTAKDWIDDQDNADYCLEHNEANRPEYLIFDADYGFVDNDGNVGYDDGGDYDWDGCKCTANDGDCCGKCNTCIALMAKQNDAIVRDDAANNGYNN